MKKLICAALATALALLAATLAQDQGYHQAPRDASSCPIRPAARTDIIGPRLISQKLSCPSALKPDR